MKTNRLLFIVVLISFMATGFAQEDSTKWLQVYGFAQTDFGYNFNQVDPKWYDVMQALKVTLLRKPVWYGW